MIIINKIKMMNTTSTTIIPTSKNPIEKTIPMRLTPIEIAKGATKKVNRIETLRLL